MLFRLFSAILALATIASAHSRARNQLNYFEKIQNPAIRTPTGRVNAFSRFDIDLELRDGLDTIRMSLEPNNDAISHDATVTYIGADGQVRASEPIVRHEHKIYKGIARLKTYDGGWVNVGWARITVLRDGIRPLFEGAFALYNDKHHIQLPSSYLRTKHELDPGLENAEDEYMILWRDSNIASQSYGPHDDLRRDLSSQVCAHDDLEFNVRHDHPVYVNMMKRNEEHWGSISTRSALGRRQIDTQSSGNGAGVNLLTSIGSTAGCPNTRKVALVGVATDCGYTASQNSTAATKASVLNLMNSASAVWESSFNISLGLQNITISDASCPGTVQSTTPWNQACSSSLDITSRLNLFSAWRGTLEDQNSHWTLLTACPTGSAVGLAWLGQACVHDATSSNSSTGGTETVSGANVVALTSTEWEVIAHETGHTFGAVHDCTTETCASNATVAAQQCCPLSANTCSASSEYIMNPYSVTGIDTFSPCTIGNICSAIRYNSVNTTCLSDNQGIITVSGAVCGNGIVEEGEECDCGGTDGCGDDACCDPTTCKFAGDAVCDDANESCCTNCQYANNDTVCRASTGVCDPEETCTGNSSSCPADVVAPNGQSCTLTTSTAKDLTCASGQCTSRNLQCQTVMAGYISSSTSSTTSSNDSAASILACDSSTCLLSCSSPSFGPGVCYGLQQNLLDGTLCGSGGSCANGICRGSTVGKEVSSWISAHKSLVIGVAVAIGALLLISLVAGISKLLSGPRDRELNAMKRGQSPSGLGYNYAAMPGPMPGYYGNAPMVPMQASPPRSYWQQGRQQHELGGEWRPPQPQMEQTSIPPPKYTEYYATATQLPSPSSDAAVHDDPFFESSGRSGWLGGNLGPRRTQSTNWKPHNRARAQIPPMQAPPTVDVDVEHSPPLMDLIPQSFTNVRESAAQSAVSARYA